MKTNLFQSEQFTNDPHFNAQKKAEFANHFAVFVNSGFNYKHWNQWFYNRLSLCFGFIAHFDSEGFWHNYFATSLGKVEFLLQCTGEMGKSDWHFNDLELAIRDWILDNEFTRVYIDIYTAEEEMKERKELLRLLEKYGIPEEYKSVTPVPVNVTVKKVIEPISTVKVIQAAQIKKVEVQPQIKTVQPKFLLPDGDR
jgi:hypothetical protein